MGTTGVGVGFGVAARSVAWASAWRRLETVIEPQKHPCFMRVENAAVMDHACAVHLVEGLSKITIA